MNVKCPLCLSSDLSFQTSIPSGVIKRLYLIIFNINIDTNSKSFKYYICNHCELRFFLPMTPGNEIFYEHLQKFDWYYMSDKWEYNFANSFIVKESNVLEIGAGKAAFSQLIAPACYTGLEFNDKAIERANQKKVRLIKKSVQDFAKECDLYDVVVSFQVLEHVSDPAKFIQGCIDCLKPDGLLIIAVPANDSFVGLAINNILNMPPHHLTHWTGNTLRKLVSIYDVELISIEYEPIVEYHKIWAKKIIIEDKIRKTLGIKHRQIDNRPLARIISKIASLFSKHLPISLKNMNGHTVAAVYRKKRSISE